MAEDVVWKGESHVNSIQQGWFERGMSLSHIASHWHHDNGMGSIVPSAPTHTLLVFLYWFGYEGGVPRKHITPTVLPMESVKVVWIIRKMSHSPHGNHWAWLIMNLNKPQKPVWRVEGELPALPCLEKKRASRTAMQM